MPELLSLVIQTARAAVSRRNDLILENLLLLRKLQVALRPKRWLSLCRQDRILWVLVRQLARIGAATFYMSGRRRSFAGPEVAGDRIGVEIENPARTSRPPSLAWRTFLRNELVGI